MSEFNTEELVEAYINIRNQREKLLREYEEADRALKSELQQLDVALLEICNNINADSIKTGHGTVSRRLNEKFYCTDWDHFYKFVIDNEAPQLLEKRVAQSNFREFLSQHSGDGLPPGINTMREFVISVRKASK
jgi:hypothetical protein